MVSISLKSIRTFSFNAKDKVILAMLNKLPIFKRVLVILLVRRKDTAVYNLSEIRCFIAQFVLNKAI